MVCAIAMAAIISLAEVPVYTGPVVAEELHARDGLGHVMEKIRNGGPVTIAYLGGSITQMTGWRNLTTDWLRSEYPSCTFKEVNAGVGGTGSDLGCYRLQQDALCESPDLLFVEFATNDYEAEVEDIWRYFEGIIRQTWRKNSKTDIVFVYTIGERMLDVYKSGYSPRAASAMEQVADFYGIPSIDFGPRVAQEEINRPGYLVWDTGVIAIAVPADTPDYDDILNAELAKEGKFLFSKDKVHPAMPGHRSYYLESIKAGWSVMKDIPVKDNALKLGKVFFDATMEKAKMVTIEGAMLSGTWTKDTVYNKDFGSYAWISGTPGAKMKIKFNGCRCDLYTFEAPPCGQLLVTVDGVRRADPLPLFSKWGSKGWHRVAERIFDGESGIHEVELELDSRQPALKQTYINAGGLSEDLLQQYARTECYLGRLLMVGDIELPHDNQPNRVQWFDAKISDYVSWPEDANLTTGGQWQPKSDLSLGVSKAETGLAFSPASRLAFAAYEGKSLVQEKDVRFRTTTAFAVRDLDALAEEGKSCKGGLALVEKNGTRSYYGLVGQGGANVWVPLSGDEPAAPGVPIPVEVVFRRSTSGGVTVRYCINGKDYRYADVTDLPVIADDLMFRKVNVAGEGVVQELSATLKSPIGIVFAGF